MNVSQMKEAIKICRLAGRPAMCWGPGGVGKSDGVEQVANELGIDFICVEATTIDPVDIRGLPTERKHPDGKTVITTWGRPEFLPEKGEGILLFDEITDAPDIVMKACYHLVLKGEVAGHKIGKGWFRMGAGNRVEDGGRSSDMPAPLITRLIHIGVYCTAPDFSKKTPDVESAGIKIDVNNYVESWAATNLYPLVVSYLKFKPNHLYHHQATPRTWEYVSDLVKAIENYPINEETRFIFGELMKGTVGAGPGNEFQAHMRLKDKLPNINALILNPTKSPIDFDKQVLFTVVTSLLQRLEKKTESNIIRYMLRIPREYQFYFFKSAVRCYPQLVANHLYTQWVDNNREYIT